MISITIAIAVAMTSLLAVVFWQVEVKATDAVLQKPEYGIAANSYLPIQSFDRLTDSCHPRREADVRGQGCRDLLVHVAPGDAITARR